MFVTGTQSRNIYLLFTDENRVEQAILHDACIGDFGDDGQIYGKRQQWYFIMDTTLIVHILIPPYPHIHITHYVALGDDIMIIYCDRLLHPNSDKTWIKKS